MTPLRWRDPNPAPAGPVTHVELFFDVVFVFTLTQLTRTLGRDFSLGGRQRNVPLSLREIAEGTGLSKRAVQTALGVLARRRLVTTRRDRPTAVPEYTVQRPWARRVRVE